MFVIFFSYGKSEEIVMNSKISELFIRRFVRTSISAAVNKTGKFHPKTGHEIPEEE